MLTRPINDADFNSLHNLIAAVYASSDFMSQTFAERYPEPEALARQLKDSTCLVAHDENRLLGYIFVTPNKPAKLKHTADLNMGVHPDAHGGGVGRRLLENAIAAVREAGEIEIVYLHVRTDNTRAVALYEKFGFGRLCVLARDTKIDGKYYDAALMRKFIAG